MTQDLGLLLLRLGMPGLVLAFHGVPLLLNLPPFSVGLLVALLTQVLAPLMIALGFATRLVSGLLVLFLIWRWGASEVMLAYGIGFLVIAMVGPGRLSLDALLGWFKR